MQRPASPLRIPRLHVSVEAVLGDDSLDKGIVGLSYFNPLHFSLTTIDLEGPEEEEDTVGPHILSVDICDLEG